MSEFNYARANSDNDLGFMPSLAIESSVECHLALWQAANSQPRVYFERISHRAYKVVYGDDTSFYPLATWALNAIETAALS